MKKFASQKIVAITFALLMLAPILPLAEAEHTTGTAPRVPILPKANPTSNCLPTGLDLDLAARVNELQRGDTTFYESEKGVPAICVNGQPLPEWQNVIVTGDRELERLRNLSREVQRQLDQRLEATLPEGQLPLDLIGSRTTLLSDSFDGRRVGGFGDWQVVTARGEAPVWALDTFQTFNGTEGSYRFGDDDGYARGAHQWLVSPEIDLGAIKGNRTILKDLALARQQARESLYFACNRASMGPTSPPILAPYCGQNSNFNVPLNAIVTAYEAAFDAVLADMPVAKHGAYLEFSYRSNLALGDDGVRVWLYVGDRQPDRTVLFASEYGVNATRDDCVRTRAQEAYISSYNGINNPVSNPGGFLPGNNPNSDADVYDLECTPLTRGGTVVRGLPGQTDVGAFKRDAALGGEAINRTAISGDLAQAVTARVNLSTFVGDRAWLLFEVKTMPDDRGIDIFADKVRFPRQEDYGFELLRVHAEGDSYLRNFRLKDVGDNLERSPALNEFGDTASMRTVVPPGNQPVVVRLHNAGEYTENGTLAYEFYAASPRVGPFSLIDAGRINVTRMRPDEVREVRLPWPINLTEDMRYRVDVTLRVDDGISPSLRVSDQAGGAPDRTPQAADPNATTVRPANAAGLALGAGQLSSSVLVRADTLRVLTAVRADGAKGAPVQVCRSVTGVVCEELFAGKKGESRTILMGVRNDGNSVQDARVEITLDLDGVDKTSTILDGAVRPLDDLVPGEKRILSWTFNPAEPGVWRARIAMVHEDGTSEPLLERLVYVQRSAGTICFDDLEAQRECGPSFAGDAVLALGGQTVTAAIPTPEGGLIVATELTHETGIVAAMDANGAWSRLADISNATLLAPADASAALSPPREGHGLGRIRAMALAPNGTLYLVGANSTVLSLRDGKVGVVPTEAGARMTNLTTAAWHGGTLWAAGDGGRIFRLVDGAMKESRISALNATLVAQPYEGTLRAMLSAPNGRLYVAGDQGLLAYRDAAGWKEATSTSGANHPASWAARNATLRALVLHEDRVFAAGDNAIVVANTLAGTTFREVPMPPSPTGRTNVRLAFVSHLGELMLVDARGELLRCSDCLSTTDPRWAFPALPRPLVQGDNDLRPARLHAHATTAEATYLLGEAGVLLTYARRGLYANADDWTTMPPLAARDGGALQTAYPRSNTASAYRGDPVAATKTAALEATRYRVRFTHFVEDILPDRRVEVRLLFQDFRNVNPNSLGSLCGRGGPPTGMPNSTACHAEAVMIEVANFSKVTDGDRWVVFDRSDIAPPLDSAGLPRRSSVFTGVELYADSGVRWAVDDVLVQGFIPGQGWRTLVAWYGIDSPKNAGLWREMTVRSTVVELVGRDPSQTRVDAREQCRLQTAAGTIPIVPIENCHTSTFEGVYADAPLVWQAVADPFDLGVVSPWHVSTALADRPVWVANDEVWPHEPGGALPRLRGNWNSRLISPVIDLSQAYDPVITFRHEYAFRTYINPPQANGQAGWVSAGDGGFVEVQYLRQGADCGATSNEVTCGWSPFYRIQPYHPVRGRGYPNVSELGFGTLPAKTAGSSAPPDTASANGRPWIGPNMTNINSSSFSYWGRSVQPSEKGIIEDVRYTDEYETATFILRDQVCTPLRNIDCVPVDLAGRKIRVAFHLETAGNNARNATGGFDNETVFNHTVSTLTPRTSFPGEGWYITDFKVLGARELGIDLRATNATFRVGYDVGSIGVGPGTRVPINVTVENRGIFDVLGYTVKAEVTLVLDGARRDGVRVDTLTLPQQPVLETGRAINHTLSWNVPTPATVSALLNATRPKDDAACAEAGLPAGTGCWSLTEADLDFAIRIEVEPIGIDRDEDPRDNVQLLGTFARPLPARTVQQFRTELVVSPENATIDITRYVPIFINNTGNVPLEGFKVVRDITLLEAPLTRVIDRRAWNTTAVVPAGTRVPLASVSDEINPSDDLFWKAPGGSSAKYLFGVSASVDSRGERLASGVDRLVSAFATYLFDDVEGGPRGESIRGDWVLGPGWSAHDKGFLDSPASYGFGDSKLTRYPASTDGSATSPLIDLSGARSAKVAFFHRYRFEPGFDGGVLEASDDGGKTWTTLRPVRDLANALPEGYNHQAPLSAASVLHPTKDPADRGLAYTGDSWSLPTAVDGWVLSQFDLTGYANITEADVPYELYDSAELGGYRGLPRLPDTTKGANVYLDKNWVVGLEEEFRYWQFENLTQTTVRAPTRGADGNASFWWSGSAAIADDGVRPLGNHMLQFEVDISSAQPDEIVIAEWWEWADRFSQALMIFHGGANIGLPPRQDLLTYVTYHGLENAAHTYRFNVTLPEVVGQQGRWLRMRADMTSFARDPYVMETLGGKFNVSFVYSPVKTATHIRHGMTPAEVNATWNTTPNVYYSHLNHDPGFAVDDFRISAQRIARGQLLSSRDIITESQAWAKREVLACSVIENGHSTATNPPCFDKDTHRRKALDVPVQNGTGRSWSLVTELPGLPGGWSVVPVRDHQGHTDTNPLPDGSKPRAWWTGMVTNCPPAENQTACPVPNSESRLATPAIDLGIVAGENAFLTFWHRYAFASTKADNWHHPLAGGGVVEISVYDPQTERWTPWKQLYSKPNNLTVGTSPPGESNRSARGDVRGGYSAYTVPVTTSSEGLFRRYDPPFETVRAPDLGRDVIYLYSDDSLRIDTQDGRADGWIQERYDVSDYIGKRVRFGFHAFFSGTQESQHRAKNLTSPDGAGMDKSGWWINDIAVVGRVIAGEPIQLRLRAGTDANVQDGIWQVDDVGVFGSRYRNNVGIFVDATPGVHGAVAGASTVMPVTIRNLGESVRRDLAIEVRQANKNVKLEITGDAPKGVVEDGEVVRLMGYTLAPGQSVTVNLSIRAPLDIGTQNATKLLLTLKEFNPVYPTTPYVEIVDNEVQGFLKRTVPFTLARAALPEFPLLRTLPASPAVGEPVTLTVTARNPGYVPVTLELACTARTASDYVDVHHERTPTDTPIVAGEYPCVRTGGDLTLSPGERSDITFAVTPTVAGFLAIEVTGTSHDGFNEANLTPMRATAVVGRTPVVFETGLSTNVDVQDNWTLDASTGLTGYGRARWSYLRGHAAPGSILLGTDENNTMRRDGYPYAADCGSAMICVAASRPVDLHNFSTSGSVYLSFWHQDRFARHDGGNVMAQVLLDEQRPMQPDSWSKPCLIRPVGDYEGRVREYRPIPGQQPDPNPADSNGAFGFRPLYGADRFASMRGARGLIESPVDFFVTDGGVHEERWSLAQFDLTQPCDPNNDYDQTPGNLSLVGRTVRFLFLAHLGQTTENAPLGGGRGQGHGWLIDDVSISPMRLEVRPKDGQRATLLDNTTKAFNLVLRNGGSFPDRVRIDYDAGNSSAPAGSIRPPTEPITIEPNQTLVVPVSVTLPRDPSLLPTEYKVRLTAQSLFDANAFGETSLDLVFAPRQWAELSVDVEAPTVTVQEGTEVFLPVTVENNGLVDSVASRVRVIDTWEGGEQVYDLDLPSMPGYFQNPDDASRVIEFRWRPLKGSVGMHTLTFVVDPDVLGEEYTRENNVVTVRVPVSDLLIPDVAIDAPGALTLRNAVGAPLSGTRDADVTRYEITAGELVSFELRIVNRGRAAATNVDVRAFIEPLSLPPKVIPYIGPGSEVVVTFNWLAQKGEPKLEFLVRTEQLEATTENNRNPARGVTLLTVKGYEVSLELPAIAGVLEPGKTNVQVPFSVTNDGNAGEELQLRATAPPGMRLQLPREGFYLRAGETYDGVATLHLAAEAVAGEQFISIEAISRENPMKVAAARTPVHVKASYAGHVAGGIAQGMPPSMVLPITLVNEGNSLEPWSVTVRLPPGWTSEQALPAKVVVPAHGTATLELKVKLPESTAPGTRAVTVRATMPNGERREGLIETMVLPLRAASVSLGAQMPKPEMGMLSLPVTVENKGNVKAPFEVVLVDVPVGMQVALEPARFELPPGGKAIAKLLLRPHENLSAGTYPLTGYALFAGVNPDTTEGRANVQALQVPIVRQDVRVGALEYAPRADLSAGDRVQVKVPVTNRGQAALANLPVHLYVDDVFIASTTIARLAPGERVDVTLNWTALPGTHTLTVVVDPFEDTVDVDREDNAVSALAIVGADTPVGGIAAGRTRVPGPGLGALLFAAVLAALVAIPVAGSRRQRR